ncbi:23S rRNA m(2)A-2503 methyltransferase [Rhodothalassium salexigens DSM 2132]|uniref:Dual-specificity RNA methyltransferase RlmN n=1 Tax=Rhodothalassium salexigens DSM 2132 TaxID=1188247 RepID=A0A4R2PKZ7_RHOSA|nr:23S rRNA (adenine(2503)-C(2))-methyltransferase RlmN [Rhodothalassium salexigens]MBB4211072.1 23S rRNA (adenine2503-C2)-methyltransferase [Rhodothalassium salexigens DSM 2132]MBK1637925.1 23S rRNA (adenine(2503)-C(2))-methyltransferase RlmN [Rhodothalassium salexigens DSM 2132]TCP36272.1 23S rRNA m(2)A-2503 methyltransferase [Rhodothalassium salexigens DSM 2132]
MQIPGAIDPVVAERKPDADPRRDILGLTRPELKQALLDAGLADRDARMRAKQVWHWVYHRGVTDFAAMANIAKPVREMLAQRFRISRPEVSQALYSTDGTRKYLLRFADGHEAEAVYIPDEDRGTLCVSSQVGCMLTCRFCHTGTQRFVRNLTAGEIVAQVMVARDDLGEWPTSTEGRRVTNIVMMGMGEPLYNFDNVKKALQIVMDEQGIQMSRRRITLSTSGVIPEMRRCGAEIGVNLAVSLHGVSNEMRSKIMPINKKYPIEDLLAACADYPGAHNARRITFEYVMLKDINDSDEAAHELVRLLRHYDLPAKVNLIPFNPWPQAPYACSSRERIKRFSDIVYEAGISAPIRGTRGEDIMAACGQLKSASQKRSASGKLLENVQMAEPIW